jgi:NAD(P)-dependent dehydrogenase (short-subunit alcohol dehydrogenase family)
MEFPTVSLEGKNAVVTGSGRGIGKWIALGLAHAGANVLVTYRKDKDAALNVANQITQMKRKAILRKLDVTSIPSIIEVLDDCMNEFSNIDILVNNAGTNVHKDALNVSLEDFERVLKVNGQGVFYCCQEGAKRMIEHGNGGKIINISSVAAFLVRPTVPNSVYSMSKAGIVMLTKALAEEWAKYNININAVAPGYFETEMVLDRLSDKSILNNILSSTPLNRIGKPKDIMGIVNFLASDASEFITGQTICVDGGRTVI